MPVLCTAVWLAAVLAPSVARASDAPPVVSTHDNRRAAGQRSGDTVAVQMEIREARWYPDDESASLIHGFRTTPVFKVAAARPGRA